VLGIYERATPFRALQEGDCARSAGHRADYERERERADQLVTSQDKLVIQLKNLRLLLQVARQDAQPVAPRTVREWWRWLRTTG
jgi:hypothetical protein